MIFSKLQSMWALLWFFYKEKIKESRSIIMGVTPY